MNKYQTNDLELFKKRCLAGWFPSMTESNGNICHIKHVYQGYYICEYKDGGLKWGYLSELNIKKFIFPEPTISIEEAKELIYKKVLWASNPFTDTERIHQITDTGRIITGNCNYGDSSQCKIYPFNPEGLQVESDNTEDATKTDDELSNKILQLEKRIEALEYRGC